MHRSAMAPEGRPYGAHARPARAFLLPQLFARACNGAALLGLVRARALAGLVMTHSLVEQSLIDFGGENPVGEIDFSDLLVI